MSRIVEAVLGYRRCDCKCNKVQQPVIINNNIFGQQQQPSGSGTSVAVRVGAPSGADTSQTQVYNLTYDQYYLGLTPDGNSMLVVMPAYLGSSAIGFKYQLRYASKVTVSITVNNNVTSLSYIVSEPESPDTYMQSATMSSSVSGGTSTLTAETSTFNTSVLDDIGNIYFLVYGDRGYLYKIRRNITNVTITIIYSAGGGFNNNSA